MMRVSFLRNSHLLVSVALVIVGAVAEYAYVYWPSCSKVIIDRLQSQDRSWTALINEESCDGVLFSGDFTSGVDLMLTGRPSQIVSVLAVESSGNPSERPRVSWPSSNVLLVTMAAQSSLKVLTRQVGGVHVDLEFEPDYATRKSWLKTIGEKPGPLEAP